jgi:hypothetical protein
MVYCIDAVDIIFIEYYCTSIRINDRIDWTNNERRFTRTKTGMLRNFLKNFNKILPPSIGVGGQTEKLDVLHRFLSSELG